MNESAVARSNSVLSKIYSWHPKFNVYVLNNSDVLLISESQQLLLASNKYQWAKCINGKDSLQSIITPETSLYNQGPYLFQQYEQFIASGYLVETDHSPSYLIPNFDDVITESEHSILVSSLCEIINMTVLLESNVVEFGLFLRQLFNEKSYINTILKKYQIVLIDDFLDPRIKKINLINNFIFIKISGESVWISPIYSPEDITKAYTLLQSVNNNQPVRKYLEKQFSDHNHGLPFENNTPLSTENYHNLKKILFSKLSNENEKFLIIYNKLSHSIDYHFANLDPVDSNEFVRQLQSPLVLTRCMSHFNQDGGSRSIAARTTVNKLRELISPITGIINHLEMVNQPKKNAVKIYRSGFFKTPEYTDNIELNEESFVQLCMGKGVGDDQSQASALCEAIERYSALYQSDIPLYKCSQSQLDSEGKRNLIYQNLQNFSQNQYQQFNDHFQLGSKSKQSVKPYKDNEIHWLPLWSITQEEQVLAPLSLCFSQVPFSDNEFGRWHSNGCAAGNNLEEAVFQALLELIERDAVAIWWYNRVDRPKFDLSQLDQNNLEKLNATLSPAPDKGHDYWVIDLTHDIGVPVMAAIGKDKNTGGWIMGFGCHLIAELAAQRALTELCQLIPIREQNSAPFDFDAIEDHIFLYGHTSVKTNINVLPCHNDIHQNILEIVTRLDQLGFETLALNYSRSNIPVSTAKVFVPGLCHIWPQLGNSRLYTLPVTLSWLTEVNNESTINQQGLFV
jgi:thiazole/oxazole-forming peptide maturase SagD family component